ncbi:MAG: GtrA family protein [Gammaproteobacteria bacterium]|nr:GtrA family protein [Gammaproteobacteria bacterium]
MRDLRKKFASFLFVGGVATAIHYGLLILLVQGFAVSPTVATTLGFTVSAVANYLLNYKLTFVSDKPHIEAAVKFIVVSSAGLVGNTAIMHFGASVMSWPYLIVQLGATAIILFWNFFGNYLWSFRARTRVISL